MLDLNKEQRTLLARMEQPNALIYRQADIFYLVVNGFSICDLDQEVCKSLIELGALVELGKNVTQVPGVMMDVEGPYRVEDIPPIDVTEWVYAADPRCFGPNWQLGEQKLAGQVKNKCCPNSDCAELSPVSVRSTIGNEFAKPIVTDPPKFDGEPFVEC